MCQILLSINPEYVQKIINGTKRYKYRKFRCRKDVDSFAVRKNKAKEFVEEMTKTVPSTLPKKFYSKMITLMPRKKSAIESYSDPFYSEANMERLARWKR